MLLFRRHALVQWPVHARCTILDTRRAFPRALILHMHAYTRAHAMLCAGQARRTILDTSKALIHGWREHKAGKGEMQSERLL